MALAERVKRHLQSISLLLEVKSLDYHLDYQHHKCLYVLANFPKDPHCIRIVTRKDLYKELKFGKCPCVNSGYLTSTTKRNSTPQVKGEKNRNCSPEGMKLGTGSRRYT